MTHSFLIKFFNWKENFFPLFSFSRQILFFPPNFSNCFVTSSFWGKMLLSNIVAGTNLARNEIRVAPQGSSYKVVGCEIRVCKRDNITGSAGPAAVRRDRTIITCVGTQRCTSTTSGWPVSSPFRRRNFSLDGPCRKPCWDRYLDTCVPGTRTINSRLIASPANIREYIDSASSHFIPPRFSKNNFYLSLEIHWKK